MRVRQRTVRSPILTYVGRAGAGVLVLVTFVLWATMHGQEELACGEDSATGAPWSELHRVSSFGLLSYCTVSTTRHRDGSVQEQTTIGVWGLAATLLVTGILVAGAWRLWTLGGRTHRKWAAGDMGNRLVRVHG